MAFVCTARGGAAALPPQMTAMRPSSFNAVTLSPGESTIRSYLGIKLRWLKYFAETSATNQRLRRDGQIIERKPVRLQRRNISCWFIIVWIEASHGGGYGVSATTCWHVVL